MNLITDLTTILILIPVAFGLILRLTNIIIDRPRDTTNRIDLLEKSLSEGLATKLATLLNHVRSIIYTQDLLRGDGIEAEDLVEEYTSMLRRYIRTMVGLQSIRTLLRLSNWVFIVTISGGLLLFAICLVTSEYNIVLLAVTFVIIVIQSLALVILYIQITRLENFERRQ